MDYERPLHLLYEIGCCNVDDFLAGRHLTLDEYIAREMLWKWAH